MQISQNPSTEETLATFEELTDAEIAAKLAKAESAFRAWQKTDFAERAALMKKAAELFRLKKEEVGKTIALEMGRPFPAAVLESEKCSWACEYYAENAEKMLSPQPFPKDAGEGYVRFDPLGVVLAVMPWNYPFWQVVRFAAPALMAGNVGILKHASNVPQSASLLERLFREAGFPEGAFQNLFMSIPQTAAVIDDPRVAAVTLTGSVRAGISVGERAGRNLKKVVLELGGSDPFIVLKDADVEAAAKAGTQSRLQNCGQTCIAAKRFIVEKPIAEKFLAALKENFEKEKLGDPFADGVTVGPLATENILKGVEEQVERSIEKGARLVTGGKRKAGKGFFFEPTILADVKKGMPAYEEEVFGPVAAVITVKNAEEAVLVANDSEFGLSSSVWTRDAARAKDMASKIEAGNVFINSMSKSDPRIPFGGVKKSGYGRELGEFGIKEFVNVKSVTISK